MYFMSYEYLQKILTPKDVVSNQLSLGRTIFAGGMAGILHWLVAIPADVLKSRLQTGKFYSYLI